MQYNAPPTITFFGVTELTISFVRVKAFPKVQINLFAKYWRFSSKDTIVPQPLNAKYACEGIRKGETEMSPV